MENFTHAFQPELIRLSQKDEQTILQIHNSIYEILSGLFSQRLIYNHIQKIQCFAHIIYYSLTQLRNQLTIGEEYVNVRPFNTKDFDYAFTDIKRSRRILYFIFTLFPFLINRIKSKIQMYQGTNKYIKNLPDVEQMYSSIKELHFAYFLIHGHYFEISKRITNMQHIFTRVPPTHNINYKNIGRVYFIILLYQYAIGLYKYYKQTSSIETEYIVPSKSESNIVRTVCKLCYDECTNIACTPCGHLFCWECIMKQVHIKPNCPICRSDCQGQKVVQLMNYN